MWSLGATLYHAVSGRPPYEVGDNLIGALYKIVHEEPPRLPDDHPMARLLSRMMVREPELRLSMRQVRDELRRLERGERSTLTAVPVGAAAAERTGVMPSLRDAAPAPAPPAPVRD